MVLLVVVVVAVVVVVVVVSTSQLQRLTSCPVSANTPQLRNFLNRSQPVRGWGSKGVRYNCCFKTFTAISEESKHDMVHLNKWKIIYIYIFLFFPVVSCLNTGSLRGFWSIGFPSSKEKNARFIRIYSCRVWSTPNIIYYIIMYRERERDLKTLHVSTLLRKIMEKMDQSCTQK